jgi:hypothetical protein
MQGGLQVTTIHVREHRELLSLASEILSAASGLESQPSCVARLRLCFARAVNSHCEDESLVIAEAVRSGRVCAALAAGMGRKLACWRADLAALNSRWPLSRLHREPAAFTAEFRPLVDALRRYVIKEESQVLARIDRGLLL